MFELVILSMLIFVVAVGNPPRKADSSKPFILRMSQVLLRRTRMSRQTVVLTATES